MITITPIIVVLLIVTWFCNTRKNVVFYIQKKLYNLPELGGGGGRGNLGNARKKLSFLWEVFNKIPMSLLTTSHICSYLWLLKQARKHIHHHNDYGLEV